MLDGSSSWWRCWWWPCWSAYSVPPRPAQLLRHRLRASGSSSPATLALARRTLGRRSARSHPRPHESWVESSAPPSVALGRFPERLAVCSQPRATSRPSAPGVEGSGLASPGAGITRCSWWPPRALRRVLQRSPPRGHATVRCLTRTRMRPIRTSFASRDLPSS